MKKLFALILCLKLNYIFAQLLPVTLGLHTLVSMESKFRNPSIGGDLHGGFGVGFVVNVDLSKTTFSPKQFRKTRLYLQTEVRYKNSSILFYKGVYIIQDASSLDIENSLLLKFPKKYKHGNDFNTDNYFLSFGCNLICFSDYLSPELNTSAGIVSYSISSNAGVLPMLCLGAGFESNFEYGKVQFVLEYNSSLVKDYEIYTLEQTTLRALSHKKYYYDFVSFKVNYLFGKRKKIEDIYLVNPRF